MTLIHTLTYTPYKSYLCKILSFILGQLQLQSQKLSRQSMFFSVKNDISLGHAWLNFFRDFFFVFVCVV